MQSEITCSGDPDILEQIIKQQAKQVDVVHATDHTGQDIIDTEIALVKVKVALEDRTAVLQIERTGYLASGRPIEFTSGFYRSDVYDFVSELRLD